METFEIFLFTSLIVSSIWLIFVVISISNENAKLKERLRNEPEYTYNVWLRALSNNLPMILDNQYGKETKGKKNHWDLYSINTEIKSFSASDLIPTEKDVALAFQKQQFEAKGKRYPDDFEDIAKKMSFKLSDLKPTEKDVALAFQKQQFEAKEKMYVEKIRQLEKILVAEEIALSVDGQVANMKADKLKYEKFELNLEKSYFQNEVERLNSLLKRAKVVMTVTEEDENILDIVDKILAEEKTTGCGYNTKITLEPNVNKKPKKSK